MNREAEREPAMVMLDELIAVGEKRNDALFVFRRAKQLGVTTRAYETYRARLRAEYNEFASHREFVTSLSFGILFPVLDPGAELAVTMCNRMPTDEERLAYGPAFWRRRKPGEKHEEPKAKGVTVLEPVYADSPFYQECMRHALEEGASEKDGEGR